MHFVSFLLVLISLLYLQWKKIQNEGNEDRSLLLLL
jgi:hypothetical protein